ncbi:NAD-dependent epimerase/dehydratase family protein [Microbulbifer salipaludis]|uniref:NAD-dependent epimerase/dehydratase family protein n=1 Tax=Microbulbifer salipaludis TaxID=187980 RepID=A0ABS3E7I5_9GAMM|nr:NAD-dependent epimerase/dehydratase family protein [Microbulbifer salipaludis]MBN8431261.1 NAD-dependent epimerase/dehydratase family protein [Microbulbifer salipaludis]
MRWVIIGSSGYIGSALCRYLVKAGASVLSVSRRASGPSHCDHHQNTAFDAASFTGLFESGDIVVYAAGLASPRDCYRRPELAHRLNCALPEALLKLAEAAGVEQFLYLSSIKAVKAPEGEVITEEGGVPATDPYGASKWHAERLLLAHAGKTRVNVLRPAAVYGDCSGASADSPTTGTLPPKRAISMRSRVRAWCSLLPIVPATGYRSVVALEDLLAAIWAVGRSECRGEIFVIAEPGYYNLALIGAAASGRRVISSQLFADLLLFPFKALSICGFRTGVLDLQRSEIYSAQRLKRRLNWQPLQRYDQFLGEG